MRMGTSKRRCKVNGLQLVLVFSIALIYFRIYLAILSPKHSSGECREAEAELRALQSSLVGCSAELFQRGKLSATVAAAADPNERVDDGAFTVADWRASLGECTASDADLKQFVKYDSHSECPDDWPTVEALIWKENCQSLPRRKCFAAMPEIYPEPYPFPDALWRTPSKDSVRWDHYECKGFDCLASYDGGVFQLEKERARWHVKRQVNNELVLDVSAVLALKKGSIRVGLDIGGRIGCFAAQMAVYNVTIITTSANEGVPFLETLALRGLIGLQLSPKGRLPFFDNSMDIVHNKRSINSLSPDEFESVLLDWDRVLRPGGVLWIEEFRQPKDIVEDYLSKLHLLQYNVHQWIMEFLKEKRHVSQLTVVLEKPLREELESI